MNVLVTGGAGFIGTSLVPMLLERGWKVRVLDCLMFGGDPLLPFFRNPNFQFVKGDVRSPAEVSAAMEGCDVVIHLAAIVGFPACRKDPKLAEEVNVHGTRNVAAAAGRDRLVLFGSTGSNYGDVKEDICTEDTPLHPLSLYGQTKTIAEGELLTQCTTVAFRFATAFGVSGRLRLDLLVNDFVYKAVTQQYLVVYEKHFLRTFIHVHDMCRAFLFAIDHRDRMAGNVYNIGSEKMNFSKQQICQVIEKQIPCYVHYADVAEDLEKRNYFVSYRKITDLGFDTTLSVEEGVGELKRALTAINYKTPYMNA